MEAYNRKVEIISELYELYVDEEVQWLQYSNERWLLKGDNNTAFLYHRVINGKRREKSFVLLIIMGW